MNSGTMEPNAEAIELRSLLSKVRDVLAGEDDGQGRLDKIVATVADSMNCDVCSIYLHRDARTLELCATQGLRKEAVHQTRLRLGEGLVGRIARESHPINTAIAPQESGFRFMPETGEEPFNGFLGVPLQRQGETLGVLVIQSKEQRKFAADEVWALETVAMVLAEMAETGAFVGEGAALAAPHTAPAEFRGTIAHEGIAEGGVVLHEPRVVITNPVADDPDAEFRRLRKAIGALRGRVDDMLAFASSSDSPEQQDVVEAYRMFAHSQGWVGRVEDNITSGLSAEASVEKEQSEARARMLRADDAYIRDRLHDLDDLFNRLLRLLTGQGPPHMADIPDNAVLVARNVGPGELLDYGEQAGSAGRKLKAVILEEGSVGSHATIVAQALAVPLVVQAAGITAEALNGDKVLVDAEQGNVYLRPDAAVSEAFRNRVAMQAEARQLYTGLRDKPAKTLDGERVFLHMNAGLLGDLPSLVNSGAEGVGLFRTELQFLSARKVPGRDELAAAYSKIMTSAKGKRIAFRTLDVGSDKMLPYMKRPTEPNPALGWRGIRISLDRVGVLRMQLQALVRGAEGRPLTVMFPLIAEADEFLSARRLLLDTLDLERRKGRAVPESVEIGAMLETPSLAFAPDRFFETADFVSIGGNDLKQFFFAADRENELVRSRYDTLNLSYLDFIARVVRRCAEFGTALSYCGVDAGKPLDAVCLAATGLRTLSMRAAAIGRVKHLLRSTRLSDVADAIEKARAGGETSARTAVSEALGLDPAA